MYCPSCHQFIMVECYEEVEDDDLASDPYGVQFQDKCSCGQDLCLRCHTAGHRGRTCRENVRRAGLKEQLDHRPLFTLADREGWKQCPQCAMMIERPAGCNHMHCAACGHHFCFKCLSDWDRAEQACSSAANCPLWDQDMLDQQLEEERLAEIRQEEGKKRAAAAHGRRAGAHDYDGFYHGEEEEFESDDQTVDVDVCQHGWAPVEGHQGSCDRCGFPLRRYGMVWGDCHSFVCQTCALHRLPPIGWR